MTAHENGGGDLSSAPVNILVVEDNADQRELTIEALAESMPHARVTEAKDGDTALKILAQNRVDAVILDYSLPGINGLEVLNEINRTDSKAPVIMVTGQGDETIAVEAMKNGAQDYVTKIRNYHEALPIAIRRAIRQNRLRTDLDEASLRARRLYELSLSAAKERRVDVLSERLVEGAAKLIGVDMSLLFLLNRAGKVAFIKSHNIAVNYKKLTGSLHKMGMLAETCTTGQPVVVENPRKHPLWEAAPWLHSSLRQVLAVPLVIQGKVEGTLCVLNKLNQQPFSPEDVDTLSTLAVHAGVAIENARFVEKIEQQAITDSLTGLYNHMEFQKQLAEEIDRCRRYGNEFALLIVDLDHFKLVNDTYGHQVGDMILNEIVRTIQDGLRSVDRIFRYGGEEFAVILPETHKDGAKMIADRVRKTVADSTYSVNSNHPIKVTLSIGVSSFPHDALQREDVITTADQALFTAKRGGRNRVVTYSEGAGVIKDYAQIRLEDYLCDPQMTLLRDLAVVSNSRCRYVKGQSDSVSQYTLRLGESLHLGDEDKNNLAFAASLRSLGVIGLPNNLLDKQGPVNDKDRKTAASHPTLVQTLFKQAEQLIAALRTILHHHERYDGRGYPRGLKGEEIPYLARVLGVLDAYNAMIAQRTPPLTKAQAIRELKKGAGTQFDPAITEVFISLLEQDRVSVADLV